MARLFTLVKRLKLEKLVFVLTVFCVSANYSAQAQDPHFSQFFSNPIYLNPAFAGANGCPRISLNFRDQWPSISGTFITYSASYDQHFDKLHGGVGAIFLADRAAKGTINTYAASLIYSFHLKVAKEFNMRFAIQATFQNKNLDWTKLRFSDMIDPRYGFIYPTSEQEPAKLSRSIADFSAGFIGYTKNLYFGFAAHHMTQPYEGFLNSKTRLPYKLTGHLGANFSIAKHNRRENTLGDMSLSPNFIYLYQMASHEFNYGLYFQYYPFLVGAWFRHSTKNSDALIFLFGVEYNWFRVGYSYDLTVSRLANVSGGAHEVSLQFLLPCPKKKTFITDLKCPRM